MSNQRVTKVKAIKVINSSYSSVFNIGDIHTLQPKTDVLAVQREGGISSDKGFELEKYPPIFQTELPFLEKTPMTQAHSHHCSSIHVPNIRVNGISSSAILQLGQVNQTFSRSRIKHIRILKD
ncbi:spore germination protein GerPE [Gracilibacillus sp. JCM 18860]|uniref:spore germination protein GerPE n=1 Tax=Gracilibacillus sp. JCM 18860 TaxID=1306159 RepID=UPI000A9AD3C7